MAVAPDVDGMPVVEQPVDEGAGHDVVAYALGLFELQEELGATVLREG